MNDEKNVQPPPEQLLKLLEMQLAASRERRIGKEFKRSNAGLIGLVVIVVGAAFALWMLMSMLEQMRPQQKDQPEPSAVMAK